MKMTLTEYCRFTGQEELLSQWDREKNGDLTPDDITNGSHRKVWWRCEKGHSWQAAVKSRVLGAGCPVCTGRLLVPGVNDLATVYPELAAQWHPTKNGALRPADVMHGTHRKIWWLCEKGHEWQATVRSRTDGRGCPVCAGKVVIPGLNDLASQYPQVASEWHESKNAPLTPSQVTPFSNRTVWWRCPLGHEYRSAISAHVMRGVGCPYCAGRKVLPGFNDLATRDPKVAAQWYEPLNAPLTPEMVTRGSNRKVWWQCGDGHVWQAAIYSRTGPKHCGCPVCAGRARPKRKYR